MGRHSKHANHRPFLSATERNKAGAQWGNKTERLSRDAERKPNACCLCLQTAVLPVITPYGHLYCKACIIKHLLHQKQMYKKAKKQYDDQEKERAHQQQEKGQQQQQQTRENFEKQSGMRIGQQQQTGKKQREQQEKDKQETINESDGLFWLNAVMRDDQHQRQQQKPKKLFIDPMTAKKPLRSKQLVDVQFGKDQQCPLCLKPISNNITMAVLHRGVGYQGCGHAICKGCAKAFVEKTCPLCNTKVRNIITIEAFRAGAGTHSAQRTVRMAPGFSNA